MSHVLWYFGGSRSIIPNCTGWLNFRWGGFWGQHLQSQTGRVWDCESLLEQLSRAAVSYFRWMSGTNKLHESAVHMFHPTVRDPFFRTGQGSGLGLTNPYGPMVWFGTV